MTTRPNPRFAIVTETFPPEINGVTNTLDNLCRGLAGRGHTLEIIRPRQRDESGDQRHEYPGADTLRVPGLPIPGYPELRFGLPARGRILRHWKRHRPDAVYIATQGPLGWSALSAARALGLPVATGFHTNFQQYSRFYHAGFLERIIQRYLVAFHNRSDCTLVPTRRVRDDLHRWGIRRLDLWSRGVDCRRFSPTYRSQELRREWGLGENDIAVLYVGRLAAEKNLVQAVATFERLRSTHDNARFVLVGDGPLRNNLQERYPDYIFCGMQRGPELARHYASGDIFLFPSLSDTFGNVVTEAMASGLAVVAFDDAAAREHIESGVSGIKVPIDDREAFIRAVQRLADQPSLLYRIRMQARQQALSLDWETLVESFEHKLMSLTEARSVHGTKQSLTTL